MTTSKIVSPKPIVICGSLRAGTTLLRLLLGQHSQIDGFGESDFLVDDAPAEGKETDAQALELYKQEALKSRTARNLGFAEPKGSSLDEVFGDLVAQHPLATDHLLLTFHRGFHRAANLLPDAHFIRLQRDPRDVALSAVQMGWGGVPYFGVDVWLEAERDWQKAESLIEPSRQSFLRYEDLVADPRKELSRILQEMGLPFEKGVLTPSGTTYSAPAPRAFEAFRKKMSEREIAELNSRLTWLDEDYGYNLGPAAAPNAARLARLRLARKRKTLGQRIERFGMPLVAKEYLARRLGWKNTHDRARAEMYEVMTAYLK